MHSIECCTVTCPSTAPLTNIFLSPTGNHLIRKNPFRRFCTASVTPPHTYAHCVRCCWAPFLTHDAVRCALFCISYFQDISLCHLSPTGTLSHDVR